MATLLAACTVGPDFHPPVAPSVSSYAMAGDDINPGPVRAAIGEKVVADWWTLFQSSALDQLVREAVAGSPTLAEARARLESARQAVGVESGHLTADMNAGAERERLNLGALIGGQALPSSPGGSFPLNPEFNLYSIGATVSYNLDLFGGIRRRVESLKATREAQAHELDAAYLTLTGHVVDQALTIASASSQIRTMNDIIAQDEDNLAIVKRAHAAGGSSAADVAAMESELAEDQSMIPAQKQRLAAARHALAILVGKAPGEWTAPDFDGSLAIPPTTLPVSVPSDLVHNRPDILEAEAKLHAATAQIGVATAALYPNITLSGQILQQALTPEAVFNYPSTSWTIAGGLTQPLFHSGELKAKQREDEADARAALAVYEQTVLQAFGQVADVLAAITHDNEAYAAQTHALDAAQAQVGMMRKAYRLGGVSSLQLLEAERTWRRTRLTLSQQSYSRSGDAAMLLLATANVPPGVANPPTP